MAYIKPAVYTLVVGEAMGNAAMLVASGRKGNRFALPHSRMMTCPPRMNRSFGSTVNMMIRAEDLEYNTQVTTYSASAQSRIISCSFRLHVGNCHGCPRQTTLILYTLMGWQGAIQIYTRPPQAKPSFELKSSWCTLAMQGVLRAISGA